MPRGFLRLETRSRAKEDVKRILTAIDKVRKWEKKWVDVKGCSLKTYKWVPVAEPQSNQANSYKNERTAAGTKRDRLDGEVSDINSSSVSLSYNDSFTVDSVEGNIEADSQEPRPKRICSNEDASSGQVSFTIGSDGESNDSDNENSENPLTADGKTESAIASGPTSDNENTKDSTISEDKNTSISCENSPCPQDTPTDIEKSEKDVKAIPQAESEVQLAGSDKDKSEISCSDNVTTTGEENLLPGNGQVSPNADKTFESECKTST